MKSALIITIVKGLATQIDTFKVREQLTVQLFVVISTLLPGLKGYNFIDNILDNNVSCECNENFIVLKIRLKIERAEILDPSFLSCSAFNIHEITSIVLSRNG